MQPLSSFLLASNMTPIHPCLPRLRTYSLKLACAMPGIHVFLLNEENLLRLQINTHLSAPSCPSAPSTIRLNNHLSDTLPTKCLASGELVALDSSQKIEDGCNEQKDGRGNQTRGVSDQTEPLDQTHDGVNGSARVICREAADEVVKD